MTQLERMDVKRTIILTASQLDVLLGLTTGEWSKMASDPNRCAYWEFLGEIRQAIIKANP